MMIILSIIALIILFFDINLPSSGIVKLTINFVISTIRDTGYLGIFLLMTLESALIPIPSEIIMPFSGYLCFRGELSILFVVLAGTIGNLVGSLIAYLLGVKYGREFVVKYGRYFLLSKKHLEKAEYLFNKYGEIIILISRMLPAVRTVISLPAGIGRMPIKKFSLYTFVGSIPWNFALTYLGYQLGSEWPIIFKIMEKLDILIILAVIVFVTWYIKSE